jgi:Rieske 2Fe-2S family protein
MNTSRIAQLLQRRQPGWSLEQAFYVDDEIFDVEMEGIFGTEWLFVAHTCEIARPGDWIRVDIGVDSLIILRNSTGDVTGFHNTCRHRGSQICIEASGHDRRLTCPYHRWTYDLDGQLVGTRLMEADFDPSGFGLVPVAVEAVAGYVFVNLSAEPSDFSTFASVVGSYLAPHQIERTKVIATQVLVEQANWKLVMENNRECYHCAGGHPELMQLITHFEDPDDPMVSPDFADLVRRKQVDWDRLGLAHQHTREGGLTWRAIRIPFAGGAVSMTEDGGPACDRLLGDLTDPDLGSARLYSMPNTWNHVCSDHVISFRVLPISATETQVTVKWLVHEDAVDGVDYDPARVEFVWAVTNDQDRVLAERNMAGIRSRAYRSGPYSTVIEPGVIDFIEWYAAAMERHVRTTTPVALRVG